LSQLSNASLEMVWPPAVIENVPAEGFQLWLVSKSVLEVEGVVSLSFLQAPSATAANKNKESFFMRF